ncbi:VOC family protein [Mesobacillus subterraneus]|uniref:VOC family protein n=1 Tax=Mesobacillus subterraneus TaxID=285983 RepID=UPI00204221DA|nr:VOC family protein [Mesobacillus subterraneus]MCM3575727.1 VOC family protein [Mesobacillus subterraneus]
MLNKVCVLTIKVEDMEKALQFYTKVLDFEVSKHYGENIVSLVHNEIPIVLEKCDEATSAGGQKVLLGILSDNLDEDVNRLREKGAKILFDESMPCPPGRYNMIEDPFGNQLELVEFSNFQ